MNNYKFGDGGFEFITEILNNLKTAWKTYLIIGLANTFIPLIALGIPVTIMLGALLSGSMGGVIIGGILLLILGIVTAIISLAFNAGNIKCVNETDLDSGYAPSAAECIKFGFSKLGTLVVFSLVLAVIFFIYGIVVSIINIIPILGILVTSLASIAVGIASMVIINIATINIILKNMNPIEAITEAVNMVMDGLKDNVIFALKLFAIVLVGGLIGGILSLIPILGTVVTMVISVALNLGVLIAVVYRFFKYV